MSSAIGNPLKHSWESGRLALGGWCHLPTPMSGEILGQVGFDWVGVDQQHGSMHLETAAAMVQAISIGGAVPIVRVPANDPGSIGKALDIGALGVIVPAVGSPEEALAAAQACRYPPRGIRSAGPIRSAECLGSDLLGWNDHVLCFVMVETREGWENLDAICATAGVDGIYVGPMDLALSLGRTPSMESLTSEEIDHLIAICQKHGVAPGIHSSSGAAARLYSERGFLFVAISSDEGLLVRAAAAEVRNAGHRPDRGVSLPRVTVRTTASYGASPDA